jgi:hypothetical protein
MSLPRTQLALEECRIHLDETGGFSTSIEAYITRGIIVLLCAEIESSVLNLIIRRLDRNPDQEVSEFAKPKTRGFVRNVRPSEIGDLLARFGEDCRRRHQDAIDSSIGEEGRARIGNLVTSRDTFAHGEPPDVTFREVEKAYKDAVGLLEAVATALGVSPDS